MCAEIVSLFFFLMLASCFVVLELVQLGSTKTVQFITDGEDLLVQKVEPAEPRLGNSLCKR